MKRFFIILALMSTLFVWASSSIEVNSMQKKISCAPVKELIEYLTSEEYAEQPVWKGYDENSRYILFLNKKTGTWSFIQSDNTTACVLGVGERGSNIYTGPVI